MHEPAPPIREISKFSVRACLHEVFRSIVLYGRRALVRWHVKAENLWRAYKCCTARSPLLYAGKWGKSYSSWNSFWKSRNNKPGEISKAERFNFLLTMSSFLPSLLNPPVLWAQRKDRIYLTVYLTDIQNEKFSLEGTRFTLRWGEPPPKRIRSFLARRS